jgi:PAS domain S-box-containing protein
MRDAAKTKKQLIAELAALRQGYAALKAAVSRSPACPQARPADPAWYRHVVEHGLGLICMHDLDGVLLFVNPAAARLLGYEPHEGIGKKLSLFLAPSMRPHFGAYLERIRSQPTDSGLMRVITKHGEERIWAYHNIRYEEPGQPPYVLGHAQDITERIQHEQELQQARDELEHRVAERTAELQRAQERFVKAFQASPDAIILVGMDNRYIDVNPGFQRLFEYSRDEVVGHTSREFKLWVNPQERITVIQLFQEQGAVYDFEVRFRTKSGTIREVLLSVEGIELDGVPCTLTIAHDVTERRQLERELIRISERERQRIGYDLHDTLGQQLAGIAFLSKVLEQRLTAHNAAEAAQAAQIVTFVNQAMEQARTLAGGLAPVTLETYGLVFALQELAASVEALFHCSCKVSSHHAIHITDHAVAMHLYRIVQEAVNNAIQHGKAQQITITLSVRRDGGMKLMVHDNGVGFPTNIAERPGMGLRIMHHRARMVGAILEIQREACGGTCVICILDNPALVSVNQMPSGV